MVHGDDGVLILRFVVTARPATEKTDGALVADLHCPKLLKI